MVGMLTVLVSSGSMSVTVSWSWEAWYTEGWLMGSSECKAG